MSKLEAKNTFYNDPRYDVVVDSRMLEQHLKEKDQQIAYLEAKLAESEKKIEELKGERLKFYTDEVRRTQVINGVHFDIEQLLVFSEYVEHENWLKYEKDKEIDQLKQQLNSQPSDIIKKIKKEFQKHLIDWYEDEENTNSELYLDADWVWEILDTILKEYGGKDE